MKKIFIIIAIIVVIIVGLGFWYLSSKTNYSVIQEENKEYENTISKVVEKCFEEENLQNKNLYINVILTNPKNIKETNKKYRNIDKETDVLSFPMFEKEEIQNIEGNIPDVLGDIVISIEKVKEQAKEYGHSFERELSYMVVHGFYHLMGYDHIKEEDKNIMRQKEENVWCEYKGSKTDNNKEESFRYGRQNVNQFTILHRFDITLKTINIPLKMIW